VYEMRVNEVQDEIGHSEWHVICYLLVFLQIKSIIQSGIDVPGNDNDLKKLQLQQLAELNGTFKPVDVLK